MRLEHRLSSFLFHWHGIGRRTGPEGLRQTLAQIRGIPVPLSDLETAILPARLKDYSPGWLDQLLSTGEVLWQGSQSLGEHDGYIAFYPEQQFPLLGRISVFAAGAREQRIREELVQTPGLEFERLAGNLGGFADDLLKTLWKLVWNGEVSSDSLDALRARQSATASRYHPRARPRYTTRRRILPGAAGRWKLLTGPDFGFAAEPERELARAAALLDRYGIVCPETLGGEVQSYENVAPLLERLEASGQAEYRDLLGTGEPQFLAVGAAQTSDATVTDVAGGALSACDPANPWGLFVPWPAMTGGYRPQRTPGARIFYLDGELAAYLTRTGRELYTPTDRHSEPQWIEIVKRFTAGAPMFLESINGEPPYRTSWHGELVAAGFSPSSRGYLLRGVR